MQAFNFYWSVFLKAFGNDHPYAFTIFSFTYTKVYKERYNVNVHAKIIKDLFGIYFTIKLDL